MPVTEVTWINGVRRLRPTSMEKCYQGLAHAFQELALEDIHFTISIMSLAEIYMSLRDSEKERKRGR